MSVQLQTLKYLRPGVEVTGVGVVMVDTGAVVGIGTGVGVSAVVCVGTVVGVVVTGVSSSVEVVEVGVVEVGVDAGVGMVVDALYVEMAGVGVVMNGRCRRWGRGCSGMY